MPDNEFQRALACYDQNFNQMRSLNDQMVKIPTISVTITGGLWFVVGSNPELQKTVAFIFLLFAGLINIGLCVSCIRIRDVISSYQEKIKEFAPAHYADGRPEKPVFSFLSSYSMIVIYSSLMALAGILSFVLAIELYWPSDSLGALNACLKLISRILLYGAILLTLAILLMRTASKKFRS